MKIKKYYVILASLLFLSLSFIQCSKEKYSSTQTPKVDKERIEQYSKMIKETPTDLVKVEKAGVEKIVKTSDVIAKLRYFVGDVNVKMGKNSKWTKAKMGQILKSDSAIMTADKSAAILNFINGDTLRINKNSTVELKKYLGSNDKLTKVKITAGNIFMKVMKKSGDSQLSIETPTAVAGIRGTQFVVIVGKDKKSLFGVYEGKIYVEGMKKRVYVDKGYGTVVEEGKAPLTPFRIPDMPKVTEVY